MVASAFDVDAAEVAAICAPSQTSLFNTAAERSKQHDLLVARGLKANSSGSTALACELFWQACRLEPRRTSTLISYVNMRLKQGHTALAAACYLKLMEERELSTREWELVQRKLQEANKSMVEAKEGHTAARTIQCAHRAARARSLTRERRCVWRAAARLQRSYLRRLESSRRGGALPFIEQVSLLRLPPPRAAGERRLSGELERHLQCGCVAYRKCTTACPASSAQPEASLPASPVALPPPLRRSSGRRVPLGRRTRPPPMRAAVARHRWRGPHPDPRAGPRAVCGAGAAVERATTPRRASPLCADETRRPHA